MGNKDSLYFYGEKSALIMLAERFGQLGIRPNPTKFDDHILDVLTHLSILVNIKDDDHITGKPRNLKFMHYWWSTRTEESYSINNINIPINNEEDAKAAFFLLSENLGHWDDLEYFNKKIDDSI